MLLAIATLAPGETAKNFNSSGGRIPAASLQCLFPTQRKMTTTVGFVCLQQDTIWGNSWNIFGNNRAGGVVFQVINAIKLSRCRGHSCWQILILTTGTYIWLHLVTRDSWIKYTNPGIPGYKCDQGAQVSRPLKLINTSLLTSRLSFLDVFLPLWLSSDLSHRGEGQLLPEEGTKSVWT